MHRVSVEAGFLNNNYRKTSACSCTENLRAVLLLFYLKTSRIFARMVAFCSQSSYNPIILCILLTSHIGWGHEPSVFACTLQHMMSPFFRRNICQSVHLASSRSNTERFNLQNPLLIEIDCVTLRRGLFHLSSFVLWSFPLFESIKKKRESFRSLDRVDPKFNPSVNECLYF